MKFHQVNMVENAIKTTIRDWRKGESRTRPELSFSSRCDELRVG